MRRFALVLAALSFGTAALAESALPAGAPQIVVEGEKHYNFFCSKCHGKEMVNAGVSSFDLRTFPRDDKPRFVTSVMEGRGNMPAWGDVLYPEELEALWAYVASRAGQQPLPEDSAAPVPDEEEEEEARAAPPATLEEGVLSACLARANGALSGMRHEGGTGLDYRVAQALADRLGLSLRVTWFEAEQDEESDPVRETYAMLAHGLCDMVPSHPLYAGAVGQPPAPRATLPRWVGMPRNWDRTTHVDLRPVTVTAPYRRAEMGLVFRGGAAEPAGLHDIAGVLGYQEGTLTGAIVEYQAPDDVRARAKTFNPGATFLWEIEKGEADVAFVDVDAYDAHLRQNRLTALRLGDWRHRLGFDIGAAVLTGNEALKAALDAAIAALVADGSVAALAAQEGAHWAQPSETGILPPLTRASLMAGH